MADVERALPQRPDKPKGKGLKASEVQARAHEAITRARSCADLGLLAEADRWCEAGLAIDKCNAGLRYLRAAIAEQQGRIELAMALLRQTIYLDQDFVLAHVALAGLCRRCGRQADAQRHYANAVRLLEDYRHDAVLPGAEGISVGWLADMIRASVEATNEDARRT
jgi:chemotaxis protein methyltransferase CheR